MEVTAGAVLVIHGPGAAQHRQQTLRQLEPGVEVAPGLSVQLVGGHTAGTQIVSVSSVDGQVIIASDASHFYENIETDRPGTIVHTMPAIYDAFDLVRDLAHDGVVLPGHDCAVFDRFPRVSDRIVRVA